jgi:putative phage-type endonuclease
MYKLAGEKVSGIVEETYQNAAMLRGIETEQEARDFYNFTMSVKAQQVGLCISDCCKWGASPDGLVGDDGLLEIKCPTVAVHVGYLLDNKLPTEYFQQVQGQLFVTGRAWCDFVSYSSGIKPLVIRVLPDMVFHAALSKELDSFCAELEQIIQKIS